jgi:hypothetical protein
MDLDTLPFGSGLLDIFTNLLWRKTKRRTLGCQDGSRCNLTTNNFQVDIFNTSKSNLWDPNLIQKKLNIST